MNHKATTSPAERKEMPLIKLNDLLPRSNVKGGSAEPKVLFGSPSPPRRR